jgi:Cof subfamily protein (haloacid dehalogenase superfamily)
MEVRLVATDLDGTLLGADGAVSARARAALAAASAAGIHVVAATGRSHWTARPKVAGVDAIEWAVCSNGAVVYDLLGGCVDWHIAIDDAIATATVAALRAAMPEAAFGWETTVARGFEEPFVARRPSSDGINLLADLPVAPLPDPLVNVLKLLINHPVLRHDALLAEVIAAAPPGVTPSTSSASFVEITGEGVDKAVGLALLCDRLGVESSEVLAFGDHRNDVAMLTWAGRGVAMANAHPEAQAAADDHAGDHTEDGVAAYLEELLV